MHSFAALFTILSKRTNMQEKNHFHEPNQHMLTFLHPTLMFRVTYWAPLGMLLRASPLTLGTWTFARNTAFKMMCKLFPHINVKYFKSFQCSYNEDQCHMLQYLWLANQSPIIFLSWPFWRPLYHVHVYKSKLCYLKPKLHPN